MESLRARKTDQLASVIATMNAGHGPNLLGVCEVENRFVVERLVDAVNALLPAPRDYAVIRGIDVAFSGGPGSDGALDVGGRGRDDARDVDLRSAARLMTECVLVAGGVLGRRGTPWRTRSTPTEEIGDVPPDHEVPAEARFYTGNIGLMKAKNGRLSKWELLAPVLSAECTNQQTERPHLVVHDGKYYLWTISHEFTFAPGVTGPDGLYGFVGDGLRSDYQALNGSALVLGNPEEAPLQNYSDYVMPNLLVESFIDTVPTADGGVRFGGTLAPTLELDLSDETSTFVREHGYGYIPAMRFIR